MAITGGYKGWLVMQGSGGTYPSQTTVKDEKSKNAIEFDYFTFGASAQIDGHTGNAVGGLHKDMVTFVCAVGSASPYFAAAVATSDRFKSAEFSFTNMQNKTNAPQTVLTLERGSVAAVRWIYDGGTLKAHVSLAYAKFSIKYNPVGDGEAGTSKSMDYDYEVADGHGGSKMPTG